MFHRFAINVYALQDECICFHRESGIEWRWKQIVTRFSSREENLLTVVYRLSMYSRRGETRDDRERESGEIFEINCDRLLPFPFIPASFFALLFYFFSFSSFLSFFFFRFFIENSVMVNIERMRKLISRLHGGKMKYKMGPLRSQLLQLDEKVIITLIVQRGNK